MRTIKEDEELKTFVKVGDIVRLEGFTDDPIIAVVTGERSDRCDCYGCALESAGSCSVNARDNTGYLTRVSICCLKPAWRCSGG